MPKLLLEVERLEKRELLSQGGVNLTALTFHPTEALIFNGAVASFTDTHANAHNGYLATINWGGSTSSGTIVPNQNGGFNIIGTHLFGEEGAVATTVTLRVTGNQTLQAVSTAQVADAPLTAQAGPQITAVEGQVVTVTVASFTDANAGAPVTDFRAMINWGDGSPTSPGLIAQPGGVGTSFVVTGTHVYPEESSTPLPVHVTIIDVGGRTAQATTHAVIVDAPLRAPDPDLSLVEGQQFSDVVASFTDGNPAAVATDYTVSIDWGDGSPATGGWVTANGSGGFDVSGAHVFEEGSYEVTVRITDSGGSTLEVTDTATVAEAPFHVTDVDIPAATEGQTFPVSASFTDGDPGTVLGDLSTVVYWGDGTSSSTGGGEDSLGGSVATGYTLLAEHQYADEGTYQVTFSVTDADGGNLTFTATASVADAGLSAGTVNSISVTEGQPFTPVVNFSDANTLTTGSELSGTVDWGDGSGTAIATLAADGNGSFHVTTGHTYLEPGSYVVTVAVTDSGGSTLTIDDGATVADGALTATPTAIFPQETLAFAGTVATFVDANLLGSTGEMTATIDWNDGSASSPGVIAQPGGAGTAFIVTGSHAYAGDEGTVFHPIVTIEDDDGASASITSTAQVVDAPLTGTGGFIVQAVNGTAVTAQVASFTDANAVAPLSDMSATINWNDGSPPSAGTITQPDGTGTAFLVAGTHTYAHAAFSLPIVVTMTDIGGSMATAVSSGTVSIAEGCCTTTGQVATFSHADATALVSDFTATIDFGDGTTGPGVVSQPGGLGTAFIVTGAHAYAEEGLLQISVDVRYQGASYVIIASPVSVADAPLTGLSGVTIYTVESAAAGFQGVVGSFTDANSNAPPTDFYVSISWGDSTTSTGTVSQPGGSGTPFLVKGAHVYGEEGSFSITVSVADVGGSQVQISSTAQVADAPLQASGKVSLNPNLDLIYAKLIGGGDHKLAPAGFVGDYEDIPDEDMPNYYDIVLTDLHIPSAFPLALASFTDGNGTATISEFMATISWGDGTTSTGVISQLFGTASIFIVRGSHDYSTTHPPGSLTFPIQVTIADEGGSSAVVSRFATFIPIPSSNIQPIEGQTLSGNVATFTSSEPSGTTFRAQIDWGDGSNQTTGTVTSLGNGGYSVAGSHAFAEEGPYTISIEILVTPPSGDPYAIQPNLTATAIVQDAPLSVQVVNNLQAVEGQDFNGPVATFTDSGGPEDPGSYQALIDWKDGSELSIGTVNLFGGVLTVSGEHTYAEENIYPIEVSVWDDGTGQIDNPDGTADATGESGTVAASILVTDAPLTGSATNFNAFLGRIFIGQVASYTDSAAAADPTARFIATINWGDGASSKGIALLGKVWGSHTYNVVPTSQLTVTVTDDGGANVTVHPAATVTAPPAPPKLTEKTPPACGCQYFVSASPAASLGDSGKSDAPVRYFDGTIQMETTDLASNGFGNPWGVTRTWTNNAGYAPSGINGSGTVDLQAPFLRQLDGYTTIAVVTDGTSALFFDLVNGTYVPAFYSTDRLGYDSATATFTLTDPAGDVLTFADFNNLPVFEQGQLQTVADPNGNVTAVTRRTADGKVAEVQRSNALADASTTESFVYGYVESGINEGLLAGVVQRVKTGCDGAWATVRQVNYTYYAAGDPYGNPGDLKTAVIADPAGNAIDADYYRYYTPGDANGYVHGLKYLFNPASYARLAAAVGDPLTATDTEVAPFADNYFEYDGQQRVTREVAQGQGCSVCASGLGAFTFTYTASANSPGFNSWAVKTVETLPDGNQNIVYTNAYGDVMLKGFHDVIAGQDWNTFYAFDDSGRVILTASPSAVNGYDESFPDLLNKVSGFYQYLNDTQGLLQVIDYYGTTTANNTTAGGVAGYVQDTKIQQGELGTPVLQERIDYFVHSSGGATTNPVAHDTVYRNADGTGAETTSYSYTWFANSTRMQSVTSSQPVVSAGQNGPGTADVATVVFDGFGRPTWTRDAGGFINYIAYDVASGAPVKTIVDVNTTQASQFTGLPAGWTTPAGGGLNLVSTMEVDALGRDTKVVDPNGNVTYMVYNDAAHEERTYHWSATGPIGPTEVAREDRANSYVETLTMSATPAVDGNGRPTGAEAIGSLQTLSRGFISAGGQLVQTAAYFNLSGLAYSTSPNLGTAGTNYYVSQYGFDDQGRMDRVQSPTGTITRTVSDGLGRVVSVWVGTDDTPGPSDPEWSPTNNGGNMVEVAENVYDNGGVGDGNLTQTTEFPGGSADLRVMQFFYDWRDRLVATKAGVQNIEDSTTHRPIVYFEYDNLDELVATSEFDGDGVTIADANTDGVPDKPDAGLLRAYSTSEYDDQGRVFAAHTFSVDPNNGAVSTNSLTTSYWFDHRGNLIKTSAPGGLVQKAQYDGAGRVTKTFVTDGGGDITWADAGNVVGDIVLTQANVQYDSNGNAIFVTIMDRFHNATNTGELSASNARVSYASAYYDALDRPTANVNVGNNGGTAYTRPSTIPARSDTVLVTSYGYSAAGWLQDVTDPRGIDGRTLHDNLGRTVATIANYTGSAETSSSDVATLYSYDGDNNLLSLTAVQPSGTPSQTTAYIYGVTTANGSGVSSNDLLAAVQHPDNTTGLASASNEDTYTYNTLGEPVTYTDRNGSTHSYSYDVLGRLTADAVITLGSGVDGSVLRMETAYDAQGNPYLFTSYDAATGGNIVNQVLRQYNGLGQMTAEYQSHAGAVDTSTTPVVQYAYTEMSGGQNNSRLTSVAYPDGYVLDYNYGSSGSLNDKISRLESLSDSTATLESYKYLGLDTVVERDHPQTGVNLSYISQNNSTGDAGDQYTGLNRFGRVVEQLWWNTATSSATDDFQYGYDRNGNVLYEKNVVDNLFSNLYQYNRLNELTDFSRGQLNSTNDGITGTASATQGWAMDALGNFTTVTTNGTAEARTGNAQNELTSVGSNTLTFDANGNMTTDETGRNFVFDAWNRLADVKDSSGDVLENFSYDGLNRRITVTADSSTTDLYYSNQWQVLEEQVAGVTQDRFVWSPVYVDAMVLRDSTPDENGTLTQRLYVQQDENWNVRALLDTSGNVVERYSYDPYGIVTVLAPDWSARSNSSFGWVYLFQGKRLDSVSGLFYSEERDYSATLARWAEQDRIGFNAGDPNFYRFVGNDPTGGTDPSGLEDSSIKAFRNAARKNGVPDSIIQKMINIITKEPIPAKDRSIRDGTHNQCEAFAKNLFDKLRQDPDLEQYLGTIPGKTMHLEFFQWELPNPTGLGDDSHTMVKLTFEGGTFFYFDRYDCTNRQTHISSPNREIKGSWKQITPPILPRDDVRGSVESPPLTKEMIKEYYDEIARRKKAASASPTDGGYKGSGRYGTPLGR